MLLAMFATAAVGIAAQDYNGWPATVRLECEEHSVTRSVQRNGRWTFEPADPGRGAFPVIIDVANARMQDPENAGRHYPVKVGYGVLRVELPPTLLTEFDAGTLIYYLASPEAEAGRYVRTLNDAEATLTVVGECRRVE